MAYYRCVGDVPRTRHTQHRRPDGGLYYEELVGEEGFSSDSSLLYHRSIPSAIVAARPWTPPDGPLHPNEPLLPRHLRLPRLFEGADPSAVDAVTGRRMVLGNADVRIAYVVAAAPSPLYRDAIGDELVYVEAGSARLETTFGSINVHAGHLVVVPRATTHRWVPTSPEPARLYVTEFASHVTPPRRFLSRTGQFLEHATYCERDLLGPSGPLLAEGADVPVLVKHRSAAGGVAGTEYVHAEHPFDVVGWDGCLYPYALDVADVQPITGRVHQPPPVHQVFEAGNAVVCAFLPRKVDYHPAAVPVPYYHSNVDSDEVMFYCGGDYAARRGSGIEQGSVSLHPGGHVHGPQPGAYERSIGLEAVDEVAIMVDTFRPLSLGASASACEDDRYPWTWAAR